MDKTKTLDQIFNDKNLTTDEQKREYVIKWLEDLTPEAQQIVYKNVITNKEEFLKSVRVK